MKIRYVAIENLGLFCVFDFTRFCYVGLPGHRKEKEAEARFWNRMAF